MSDLDLTYPGPGYPDYQGVGQMCGEGSHPVCQAQGGFGHHHYNRPDLDNGLLFACGCGCHYVPAPLGRLHGPLPDHTWR
jgi:hypothetical protein